MGSCTQQVTGSFDHFVGEGEQVGRQAESQRLGGLQVDDKFEFGGLQHRKVSRFLAPQNTACVDANLTIAILDARTIAYETAGYRGGARFIASRDPSFCRECNQLVAPAVE